MEKKRLGLCSKTLIVVPNHLTEQMASEALLLYPNAEILVAKKTDFKKENRKKFCARIATGNYDIIVIGHSHQYLRSAGPRSRRPGALAARPRKPTRHFPNGYSPSGSAQNVRA